MVSGVEIAAKAAKALGTPYVWGGDSLSRGVDCSGLVQQVFGSFGISVPRVTYDQINAGVSVGMNKLAVGDLVFFDTDRKRSGPDHVGIYTGGGKFIHAPRPGSKVKISSLGDSYYADRWMGGRRVSGVTSDSGYAQSFGEVKPKLDSSELAERYGMSLAFFESQPELNKLLKQAVKGQWTEDRFQASLKGTKWWRENSKSAREFQVLSETDPASAKASLEAQRVKLEQTAVQMGAILTRKQLDKAAKDSLAYKWNDAQVQNFLGKYIRFTEKKSLLGMAGTAAKEIKGMAYDNGVSMSEQAIKNYAQYVIKGVSTMQDVKNYISQQAVGAYPAFEEQINAGATVREAAEPYIQMMSEELGVPDTDIDVRTAQIRQAMGQAGKDGKPVAMGLDEFQRSLRGDPRWAKTDTAREKAMGVGRQVLADMGLVTPAQGGGA